MWQKIIHNNEQTENQQNSKQEHFPLKGKGYIITLLCFYYMLFLLQHADVVIILKNYDMMMSACYGSIRRGLSDWKNKKRVTYDIILDMVSWNLFSSLIWCQ